MIYISIITNTLTINPLSPFLAELFMDHIEKVIHNHPPKMVECGSIFDNILLGYDFLILLLFAISLILLL